jgi:LytS/YehU family sensor histidine kinase
VLHNSELDFVRLENEIKVLDVYLELEQLRFDDDFTFEIINEVNDDVEIPPMIIQPFVENAIKHGLLHLEAKKELSLTFKLANDILSCTIKDNGIGREKSKAINERKAKNHQSFSTKSIQNRFEILQNIHGGKLGLVYEDIVEAGDVKGTIVHLKIPVKRDY